MGPWPLQKLEPSTDGGASACASAGPSPVPSAVGPPSPDPAGAAPIGSVTTSPHATKAATAKAATPHATSAAFTGPPPS